MQKHKILLSLMLLFSSMTLRGQHLQASLSHYTTDEGLASNAIAYLMQDDFGYIWIATWNGVSRYDGYNFYNYRTGNGSHIPHLHNRVMDMVADHQQNIWLRMYDGRVFVIDRRKDCIVNPLEEVGGADEYRTAYPLATTSTGEVLASMPGVGLYKMALDNDGHFNTELINTAGLTVTAMVEGYHNDIWVGTEKGVHRIDMSNLSLERRAFFEEESITALFSNGYNIFAGTKSGRILLFSYGQDPVTLREASGLAVTSIFVDSRGLIWFADSRFGASKLDMGTGVEKHFEQYVPVPEHDGQGGVFNETNGTVWIRMNHGGYGYYNRETDEVEFFHNDPSNPWNLSNTVNASLELPEGVVFMSTSRRALEKLEILKNTIQRTLLVENATSTIDNEIRGMYYDSKRHLLLMGNKNNALFVMYDNGQRQIITHDDKGQPIGRTYGISSDSKGNYWLASKDHGMFKMTPKPGGGFAITNYCHEEGNGFSLSSNSAYQSVEDASGNIWIATYGGGVNVLTKNSKGQTVVLNPKNTMHHYPLNSHMKVRTITTDAEGNVWAGTTDGILIMRITKNGQVETQRMEDSEEHPEQILMSNDIVYLTRDKKGTMWIGTSGGGLSRTTGKDRKGRWLFETFGSADGLPSEEIKSITFDPLGNVWFATDHVLCSFDVEKRIFTTFSSLDGVDETMCSEGAALTLPNGNILFGTLNGYYTVDRKRLTTDNGAMLKLRITDFFLNDELQSPRLNGTFDFYVPDAKAISLPSHNSVFAFRFAAMNYQLQHRIHYQYRLEGYDAEWRNADKARTASYVGVPTGTYRFMVKAFLLESPDKYDMRTITIVVPPYFLLSKGAVWLYMVLAIIAAIGLMFWRQKRIAALHEMKVIKLGPQEMAFKHAEDYDFVKEQMDWLEQHYGNPELKVDDMVNAAGLSRTAFYTQVKELTGLSPKELVSDFRLKKATMFLEQSDLTIAEIAQKAGFSDSVYFTTLFKQKTGITPSEYREKQNNNIGSYQTDRDTLQ